MALASASAALLRRILGGERRPGKKPCQGRQSPKAGAEGPPLQGFSPRTILDHRGRRLASAMAFSAIFPRIHAAANSSLPSEQEHTFPWTSVRCD
jgi:hypothetical protein